jgi:prepilin-type N-terminal cleavage/methylation domain-containing protein
MRKSGRGFSLIELLIVVSIILIIAAIAIPDLLKSRTAANQASAVGSLRMIVTSEVSYASTYTIGYSSTLAQLDGNAIPSNSNSAGLIDSVLGSGTKSSYKFYYVPCLTPAVPNNGALAAGPCGGSPITIYQVSANPSGGLGFGNYYFEDSSAVIRQNSTAPAGPADTPIGG